MRRLLCPGESVNALTVGAAHSDLSDATVMEDGRVEPFVSRDLANVISAVGSGVRRSVKPDLLFPGGRQMLRPEPDGNGDAQTLSVSMTRRAPGVKHATVGATGGDLKALAYASGTSVATALAGHRAGELLTQLDELRADAPDAPGDDFDAVLLKAALAHAARWGNARSVIDATQEDLQRIRSRAAVARLVGYGLSGPLSPLDCNEHRVTVFTAGSLVDGKEDVFRLPLPASLASSTTRRRISLTLAWLTPINPAHRHYRRAALKLGAEGYSGFLGKRSDAEINLASRGTLQHEVFESERATPFASGSAIELLVSCRADAGSLEGSVPYALFATMEIPEGVGVSIYQEVRQALRVPVQVRAR
jgi:hypothetical protein